MNKLAEFDALDVSDREKWVKDALERYGSWLRTAKAHGRGVMSFHH